MTMILPKVSHNLSLRDNSLAPKKEKKEKKDKKPDAAKKEKKAKQSFGEKIGDGIAIEVKQIRLRMKTLGEYKANKDPTKRYNVPTT